MVCIYNFFLSGIRGYNFSNIIKVLTGFKHLQLNSIKIINLTSTYKYYISFILFKAFLFRILLGTLRKPDSFFVQSWIVVGGMENWIDVFFVNILLSISLFLV